jgi:hypothetical protein
VQQAKKKTEADCVVLNIFLIIIFDDGGLKLSIQLALVLLHSKRLEQYYAIETKNFICGLVEHNIF